MRLSNFNPPGQFRFALLVSVAVLVVLTSSSSARADLLQWDCNGAAAPNPAGGTGTWSPTNSNWWNGSANQAYDTGTTPHDTVFGLTGGAISISSAVAARSLRFDVSGYVLSGNQLTLANSGTITVTNAADTASIAASLAGTSGLTKDGEGKLVLSGVNTFSGLRIRNGTVSVRNDEHLGDVAGGVNLDGGTLLVTGSSSLKAAETRDFNIGSAGGTFDIQNSSDTGLTIQGYLNGTGPLVKTGPGTLRLDASNNMFAGGITIEDGVLRFNNNNDAGPRALRMNTITFAPTAGSATVSMGGSGDTVDGGASELRTGGWVSATPGAGTIVAATTVTDPSIGASGHDLTIFALADAAFSGTVSNLATSNGGVIGAGSSDGELAVRGSATQTLSGTTNVNSTVSVYDSAGLTLSGTASITGSGADVNVNGGTFSLDNSSVNLSNRFADTGSIETRGGGRFVLIGNAGGSAETVGQIQLGTSTTTPPNARSGALNVQVTHNAGSSAATVLTFSSIVRDAGRATVDFSARDGAGAMNLGMAGNAPRIILTTAPSLSASGLFTSPGGTGWATVNGSDFASYDAATGAKAASTVGFAAAASTDNALLTTSEVVAGSSNKTVASLKISPSAAQSLDLTGSGSLQTPAILLAGAEDFTIRNTGAGTGGLLTAVAQHIYVQQADLTIAASITGSGDLIKSGAGTLLLEGTNTYSGTTTINEGQLRAAQGVGLGPGVLEFRGGVLEITGGGIFNRHLDFGTPSGPGRLSWTKVTGLPLPTLSKHDRGSGGFAAVGADVVIDLNGLGPSDIVWEDPSFVASGYALVLGSPNADSRVELVDNFGLGVSPGAYNSREIRVIDNPGSTADVARMSGIIFSDSAANNGTLTDLLKTGDGTLELTGNNTYIGGTIVANGMLLLGHDNALGQPAQNAYVLLGTHGGAADVALLTSEPVSITRDITIPAAATGKATLGTAATGSSYFTRDVIVGTAGSALPSTVDLVAKVGGTAFLASGISTAEGYLGAAELNKNGPGKVVLDSISNYGGNVNIVEGALHIDPSGKFNCQDLFIQQDGTLVVDGMLHCQNLYVGLGGMLAPGNSPGGLVVEGDLASTGVIVFDIVGTAGGQLDHLTVTGEASLGGTVKVVLGYIPVEGDSFDLMDWASLLDSGYAFDMSQAALPGGLQWDTTNFAVNGTIRAILNSVTPGDATGDGVVDAADYIAMKHNFGLTSGASLAQGDFNGDEKVDWLDLRVLMSGFGAGGTVPATVPEPAMLSLLALDGLAMIRRKRLTRRPVSAG